MAENFDVTSANAELVLVVEDLFPSGVSLEHFTADGIFSSDAIEYAETRRSVDGKMVAGVIKNITSVTVNLEAASPSYPILEHLRASMDANNKPYECTLIATIPSLSMTRTFIKGVLKSAPPISAAQRTMQPTAWVFDFERVQ